MFKNNNFENTSKVNILFLINDLKTGGAEKMLLYLLRGLDRSLFNPVVCTLLDRGEYKDEVFKLGIKYYSLNLDNVFKLFSALYKLIKIIKSEKISIIHSYLFYADILARIAGMLSNVKIVITSMRNVDLWRKWYHTLIDSLTYSLSTIIISNSIAGALRLNKIEKIPANKIKVIHNAIDIEHYKCNLNYDRISFRKSLNINSDDIVIINVARLVEQKDHQTFLKVAKKIIDTFLQQNKIDIVNKLKFVIVGDGPLNDKLKKLSDELELNNHVIFLGLRRDINELLHISDIFLLTSTYEGIPNSILEALACGIPVVSTNVGGVSEIITDEYDGLLCNSKDINDISGKVIRLINDGNLRQKLIQNGLQKIKTKFSYESLINKTISIYKNLLFQKKCELAKKIFDVEEYCKKKLNILYLITSSDIGGAQKHVITLAKYFLNQNFNVKVATSYGEPMNSSLKQIGINPIIIKNLQKKINPIKDFLAFCEILNLLFKGDFNIIHCHSTKAGILGRIAAFWAFVPIKIFTAHGFVFHDKMNFIKKFLCVLAEKIGGIFSDAIITVSKADYIKAVKYKIIPLNKLKYIPNGINFNEIKKNEELNKEKKKFLRQKYKINDNDIVLGSVGRLVYEKAYDIAIIAFSKVINSNLKYGSNLKMIIAGDGYEYLKLKELINKLSLNNHVLLLGNVENPYEIYSIIDIFFLSSIKEGLPYSLLEAACFALPTICTNAGGISEIIINDQTGILVEKNNIEEFYRAILKMLNMSKIKHQKLGLALSMLVKNKYSEFKMLKEIENFYFHLAKVKGLI